MYLGADGRRKQAIELCGGPDDAVVEQVRGLSYANAVEVNRDEQLLEHVGGVLIAARSEPGP